MHGISEGDTTDLHSLRWNIPQLKPVFMHMENSVHYQFNTEVGAKEWEALISAGNNIWLEKNSPHAHTISMFHQLECLNIIRQSLVAFRNYSRYTPPEMPNRLTHHCMNYLRQMVSMYSSDRTDTD